MVTPSDHNETLNTIPENSFSPRLLEPRIGLDLTNVLRKICMAMRPVLWVLVAFVISKGSLSAAQGLGEQKVKNPTKASPSPDSSHLAKHDFSAHYEIVKGNSFLGLADIHIHKSSTGHTQIDVQVKDIPLWASILVGKPSARILGQRRGNAFYPEQTEVKEKQRHLFSQDGWSAQNFYKGKTYHVRADTKKGRILDELSVFYQLALDQRSYEPQPSTCYYIVNRRGGRSFCYSFKKNTKFMLDGKVFEARVLYGHQNERLKRIIYLLPDIDFIPGYIATVKNGKKNYEVKLRLKPLPKGSI